LRDRVFAPMATAEWSLSPLCGLFQSTCLEAANPALKHADRTMSGIGAAQTSSRALYVNCSCITTGLHGTDQSAERVVVRVYTACSVPIRKSAIFQQAHAEHLGYETSFVCSATSARGASRQPAHALHPLQKCPLLVPLRWIALPASCAKWQIAYSRQHPSGQLTAGKQSPVLPLTWLWQP
jgi:hypothetical protein